MEPKEKVIKVALVDDHVLLRNALTILINSFENCRVVNESANGKEIKEAIESGIIPDLIIMDLNMPVMDGFETSEYLHAEHPQIPILMLTMYDSELSLIRLLQTGVKGFLKKDIHPAELKFAIRSVVYSGFYYSSHTTGKLINLFRSNNEGMIPLHKSLLTSQEIQFMQMICSDLTYKEVAQKMGLNPRSVDTLRDALFVKLDVKSRVGLAMLAIRHGIVTF